MKFKTRDKVTILRDTSSDYEKEFSRNKLLVHGDVPTIPKNGVIKAVGLERALVEFFEKDAKMCLSFPIKNLELIEGKKAKPIKVNYLLKYDLDQAPTEEFETMTEVKKRIQELAKDKTLRRDSIVFYEVKKRTEVVLETRTVIKGLGK